MNSPYSMTTLRARWVLPVDRPPIEGGVVSFLGDRITFVGRAGEGPAGPLQDLGDQMLLPGLVNTHTHLELGGFRGRISPRPLWDWFDELLLLNRLPEAETLREQAVSRGAADSLAAGVTTLGDISRTGGSVDQLADSPIRKVCFVELISGALSLPNDAASLRARIEELRGYQQPGQLRLGISPHAPYSVSQSDLRVAAALASQHGLPITMHLLETEDEVRWFQDGSGDVAAYLARYGLRRNGAPTQTDAVSYLNDSGILSLRPLLAHVNYITDGQIAQLAKAGASVAWCPRTHTFFGHPAHRWRDMLSAGVNVCLGTDSLASAPTLSILDEIRHIHAQYACVDPAMLLEMATIRGAEALGIGQSVGTLTIGKLADMIALPWDKYCPAAPYQNLLTSNARASKVWLNGRIVQE